MGLFIPFAVVALGAFLQGCKVDYSNSDRTYPYEEDKEKQSKGSRTLPGDISIQNRHEVARSFMSSIEGPNSVLGPDWASFKETLDPEFFKAVAALEKGGDHKTISNFEAYLMLDIIRPKVPKVQALFRLDECPDGKAVGMIIKNLLRAKQHPHIKQYFLPGGVQEAGECDFETLSEMYSLKELRGLLFHESKMPSFWREVGRPVFPVYISKYNAASSVMVSNQGHFLTAAHVLTDDKGELIEGLRVSHETAYLKHDTYPIPMDTILMDEMADLAVFQVPEFGGGGRGIFSQFSFLETDYFDGCLVPIS